MADALARSTSQLSAVTVFFANFSLTRATAYYTNENCRRMHDGNVRTAKKEFPVRMKSSVPKRSNIQVCDDRLACVKIANRLSKILFHRNRMTKRKQLLSVGCRVRKLDQQTFAHMDTLLHPRMMGVFKMVKLCVSEPKMTLLLHDKCQGALRGQSRRFIETSIARR